MVENTVILQRVRNRIIEWLEWVTSEPKESVKYGVFELINSWEDFGGLLCAEPKTQLIAPVFSQNEINSLNNVCAAVNNLSAIVMDDIWNFEEVSKIPEFKLMTSEAARALEIFDERGKFDEDISQYG